MNKIEGLIIAAGAGMGVDSGLPDFRGTEGFWKAYPLFKEQGLEFPDVATPGAFETMPDVAWGFYEHRRKLYAGTTPHEGFNILKTLGDTFPKGSFVFTSNVDGHFQKAGFDPTKVLEVHGTINKVQCLNTRKTNDFCKGLIPVKMCHYDEKQGYVCPCCLAATRPNIMMFGDRGFNNTVVSERSEQFFNWLEDLESVMLVEVGAGKDIPTVRGFSDAMAFNPKVKTWIRINPRDDEMPQRFHPLVQHRFSFKETALKVLKEKEDMFYDLSVVDCS